MTAVSTSPSRNTANTTAVLSNQSNGINTVSTVPTASDEMYPASNMLRVPASGYGLGAIPRRPFSRDSSAESTGSNPGTDARGGKLAATKTCFCGHYTEVTKRCLKSLISSIEYLTQPM